MKKKEVQVPPDGYVNLTKIQSQLSYEIRKRKNLGNFNISKWFKKLKKDYDIVYNNDSVVTCKHETWRKETWACPEIADAYVKWIETGEKYAEFYREEVDFGNILSHSFSGVLTFINQYSVMSYFIDFYCPELNIAIEFDEEHHKMTKDYDKKRQLEIEGEINCEFIRHDYNVNYGKTINLLIKKVIELKD